MQHRHQYIVVDPYGYEHTLLSEEGVEYFIALFENPPVRVEFIDGILHLFEQEES